MRNSVLAITNYRNPEEHIVEGVEIVCRIDLYINKDNRSAASIKKELRGWEEVRKCSNIAFNLKIMGEEEWYEYFKNQ